MDEIPIEELLAEQVLVLARSMILYNCPNLFRALLAKYLSKNVIPVNIEIEILHCAYTSNQLVFTQIALDLFPQFSPEEIQSLFDDSLKLKEYNTTTINLKGHISREYIKRYPSILATRETLQKVLACQNITVSTYLIEECKIPIEGITINAITTKPMLLFVCKHKITVDQKNIKPSLLNWMKKTIRQAKLLSPLLSETTS
jgi:hypothetical protein